MADGEWWAIHFWVNTFPTLAVPVPNRCRSLPSFLPCFLGPSTLLYVLAGALGSFCPFSVDCKTEPFRLVELRICRYIRKYYICRGAIVLFRCGYSALFLYVSAEPWCCLKPAGHGFKARVNDFPHSVFILTFAIRIKTPLIAHCLRPSVQSCRRHAPSPSGQVERPQGDPRRVGLVPVLKTGVRGMVPAR